jgi:predicted RNA polymerase sigma factor
MLAQEAMADAMAADATRSPQGVPEDPAHELWRNCRGSPGIFDHWMKLITHLEAAGEPVQPGTNCPKSSM